MKKIQYMILTMALIFTACQPPVQKKKAVSVKQNYIILLDLSDRLIVQPDQPARDKELIKAIYQLFEQQVKKDMYIKSRDEIKVVIAPQRGAGLQTDIYEDKLYVNMGNIKNVLRRTKEEERRTNFFKTLDDLYDKAVFSKVPEEYYGADIWKYVYEDLYDDLSKDNLTKNYLFILTDGYPIVGKDLNKLEPVNKSFPLMEIILLEGSPRDKDLEWDHIMEMWTQWFGSMKVEKYTFIKRKAISKEVEQIKEIIAKD
jgi:hypothetical protein